MKDFFKKLKAFVWSKHFLKHGIFIFLTYVIVIFLIIFYLDAYTNHGEKIEVPNLVNMNATRAKEKVIELDLKIETLDSVYRPDLPNGTVVSQDPLPTAKSSVHVKSGRIIRVQISKRSRFIEMPGLIDRSERFAESVLKNRGLKFKKKYVPTSEADGAVLKQLFNGKTIEEGQRLLVGSLITLVIGQNEAGEPVMGMNFVNQTISEARGRLAGTSLTFLLGACDNCLTAEDSTTAIITTQSPEFIEGQEWPAGTTITVNAAK